MIDTLLIFAAGFGKRMLPLTKDCPKPLLEIAGRPMLYHVLFSAQQFPFKNIYINSHYLPHNIEQSVYEYKQQFLSQDFSTRIEVLHEEKLFETGGTIKHFSHLFESSNAIFTINSDSLIISQENIWQDMLNKWEPSTMDFLLLVNPLNKCFGSKEQGDFDMDSQGRLNREKKSREFMYCGLQILKPNLIKHASKDTFSLSDYYLNKDLEIWGHKSEASFYHISNPLDYAQAKLLIS